MSDIIDDDTPCVFSPRSDCNRILEGEWSPSEDPRDFSIFVDCDQTLSQLSSGVTRQTITNLSDTPVYFFDRTGKLVYTALPTNETDSYFVERFHPSLAHRPKSQSPEYYVSDNPVRPSEVRPGSRRDPLINRLSKDELYGGRRVGDEYHRQSSRHGPTVFDRASRGSRYRDSLIIQLRKVNPIGRDEANGVNKKRSAPASTQLSRESRMYDVLKWDTRINIESFARDASEYSGCDAIYHPGLELWLTTNRQSSWVGEIAYTQIRDLVFLNRDLIPNKIAPVVVFHNKNDFTGKDKVMVFTLDRKTMYRALMITSEVMDKGHIRIAHTQVVANEQGGISPVHTYTELSLLNLRMNDYQVVVGGKDFILAENPGILSQYLLSEIDEVEERIHTAKPYVDGQIPLAEHNRILTNVERGRKDDREALNCVTDQLTELLTEMGSDDAPAYSDVRKRIHGIVGGYREPKRPPKSRIDEKIEKVTKRSSSIASFVRNTKEIIIAIGVIVGALGAAWVWAKQRMNKPPETV